jgi:hypothetical protein
MRNKITAFYVENFKAIEKGTWFELKDLNILTGANNSGKSTLFKAMKIFTDGFVDGDFPLIEINKVLPDCGYFTDLINFNTNLDFFKIGFRFWSTSLNKSFEVIYRFENDYNNLPQNAEFVSVDINVEGKHLLTLIFSTHFSLKTSEIERKKKYGFNYSHLNDDCPGEIIYRVNIDILSQLQDSEVFKKHADIFVLLEKNFGSNWIGELLIEEDFCDRKHFVRISEELFYDLFYNNFFLNLLGQEEKLSYSNLVYDGSHVQIYNEMFKNYDIPGFVKDYFEDLFSDISAQLRFFHSKKLFHIDLTDLFHRRMITDQSINFRIPKIPEKSIGKEDVNLLFMREKTFDISELLSIFDINYTVVVEEFENVAYRLLLKDKTKDHPNNLADFGKGLAQLVQLLLAIGYKIVLKGDEDWGRRKSRSEAINPIFHIEEPEAYLHPSWQSKLADMFIFLVNKFSVQFLIETHSEYLVRKLQYLIAKGEFKANNVSILYFEEPETRKGKSKNPLFRTISLDDNGRMSQDFGPGFFDEADNIAIQLFNINQQSNN